MRTGNQVLQRGVSKQLAVENTHNPTDPMEFFHTREFIS